MKYRVFDTSVNRLFGTFDTEAEAMTLVRTLVGSNEDDWADDLAVSCERPDGSFDEPLSGAALLARAEDVVAKRETVGISGGNNSGDVASSVQPVAAKGNRGGRR